MGAFTTTVTALSDVIVPTARWPRANDSRRYRRISAFVRIDSGPSLLGPVSAFSPTIAPKNKWLANATCFTCCANVCTPLNSPVEGAKEYLSSGMVSAKETKSLSTMLSWLSSSDAIVGLGPAFSFAENTPNAMRHKIPQNRNDFFIANSLRETHQSRRGCYDNAHHFRRSIPGRFNEPVAPSAVRTVEVA